jgi:hypothetical protein
MSMNDDYEYFAWLTKHPHEWSAKDLSTAKFLVKNQEDAIASSHPKALRQRASHERWRDELNAAIAAHLHGNAASESADD